MIDIHIDFEAYYAPDYSLKKLPPVLYVRDERFKAFGVGIAVGDQPARWFTGEQIKSALDTIDWSEARLVGHNLLFDGLILFERYGHKPARYLDTLYLAAMMLPVGVNRDLDSAGEHLCIGGKQGKESLAALKGVRDPTPGNLVHLGDYCKTDVEITRKIKEKLLPGIPESELEVFHLISRMGIEATIVLDEELLIKELENVKANRHDKIDASGKDISVLSSNDQFIELLRQLVSDDELPYKTNAKGIEIPALAKNDPEWIKFRTNHPELVDICEAREHAKSTIHVTRTKRFLDIARTERGTLPMPMKGWGAHTGRPSGTGGLNVMNLPALYRSNLRRALRAPEDHVIAVCDSAQIELRTQLWLSGQTDKHDLLAGGQDLYRHNSAAIYSIPVEDVTDMQRKIGKAASLGLQYRMGATRYRAYMAGGPLGMDPIFFTVDEANNIVQAFRGNNPATVAMWNTLDSILSEMYEPEPDRTIGPMEVRHEAIVLPNGAHLDYTGLRGMEDGGWAYGVNGATKFLHGGVILENCTQALANVIVMEQLVRIDRELPARVVGTTYDEVIAICHKSVADEVVAGMIEIMSLTPSWAPGLVLSAEGSHADNYIC